jgi:chloramphenicol 3-O phosphotransferase
VVEVGQVVVLNGTSSAGKTSLALAFQELRAARRDCWIVIGIDDFIGKLPGQWIHVDAWQGPYGSDGVRLERDDDTARFRVGEIGRRLLSGYRRSVAELARCGLNVVVDDVMIEHHEWDEWQGALAGVPVVWVGVRCNIDVVVQREADRGDRARGIARGQAETVHRYPVYDLELDSTSDAAGVLAGRLDAYLEGVETPRG